MQISPILSSRQPTSPKTGAPNFAGKDKSKGKDPLAFDKAEPKHPKKAKITLRWCDQVFNQPFFLSSKGGAPFIQALVEVITQSKGTDQPEDHKQPQHRQAILNTFDSLLKGNQAKLSASESFSLLDSLLSGSPHQKQLAEKLDSVFAINMPDAQARERAQAKLDKFTQILPCKNPGLIAFDHLAGHNIPVLQAGDQPEQLPSKPEGFDRLSADEQQALASLIETTPGLDRNRQFRAMRHLNPTSSTYADGYTPLHVAVEYGYLPIVKALLKMPDVDVNARTGAPNSSTILMTAVRTGNVEILKALLTHPDSDVKDRSDATGDNALEFAQHIGKPEIIDLLKNHIQQSNITLTPRSKSQPNWDELILEEIRAQSDRASE